jgi:hypothetical protein
MARIDIVGGGIAGLILAIALKDSEHQVVLHEPLRGTDLTEADTALGLWHPALLALDRVGVGDAVRRFGTPITEARMGTADGRVLGRITGQDVLLLGRVSLRDLLLDALPARVSWDDSRVQDVTALPGDLIVGADGARSVVRSTYWGNSAHPAHVTVVRGVLDEDRSTGILEEFWGDGGVFGLTPLPAAVGAPGPARTNWFAAFREHRFASTEDALGHVRHLAAPFPQRVQDAMRAAAPEQTKVNGISVSPATRSFVRGADRGCCARHDSEWRARRHGSHPGRRCAGRVHRPLGAARRRCSVRTPARGPPAGDPSGLERHHAARPRTRGRGEGEGSTGSSVRRGQEQTRSATPWPGPHGTGPAPGVTGSHEER